MDQIKNDPVTIAQKLQQRVAAYNSATREVMLLMPNLNEAIASLVASNEGNQFSGSIFWKDVDIVPTPAESPTPTLIRLMGEYLFDINQTIPVGEDGGLVEITHANRDYFARAVRVSIPLELIGKSPDFLVDYLNNLQNQYHELLATQVDEATEVEVNQEDIDEVMEATGTPFDLDNLTTEQQNALKLYLTTQNGTKNDPHS